jgi:hypothetical protein
VLALRLFNGGNWTQARFNSFIKSALRAASTRWPPKFEVKKAARVDRGLYTCAGYKRKPHRVTASIKINGKRRDNAIVDHIDPIIDPSKGFISWDSVIERMFCEADGLQVLCHECHKQKTQDEKEISKNAKRKQ